HEAHDHEHAAQRAARAHLDATSASEACSLPPHALAHWRASSTATRRQRARDADIGRSDQRDATTSASTRANTASRARTTRARSEANNENNKRDDEVEAKGASPRPRPARGHRDIDRHTAPCEANAANTPPAPRRPGAPPHGRGPGAPGRGPAVRSRDPGRRSEGAPRRGGPGVGRPNRTKRTNRRARG